jgi:hypothetical protein
MQERKTQELDLDFLGHYLFFQADLFGSFRYKFSNGHASLTIAVF